ncbi:MAG: lipase family protein [Flavobacteriales bacterium]|nr:lipase family protein [Flavobacteriales bacterium]MDG1779385.1 lipase family protein [Flavobacteriales bacterium]MDG2245148.1 lipase family protein [Flavobacteriales bacterium]
MKTILLPLSVLLCAICFGQNSLLKPGYHTEEYLEMIRISTRQLDSLYNPDLPAPKYFERAYRSKPMGLDNRWELWVSGDSLAAISIRGTTKNQSSWVENFYSVMVPAKGSLHISNDFIFDYQLCENEKAAVHCGWLIGTASLVRDIMPKIDSCFQAGIKDFYITGHSQGGAISFLMASYLESQKNSGRLDSTITFKTYCSAAPKPGNLYFAYEYEATFQKGWAYNIVNSADWVPEGPFTIQTIDDYNYSNPFKGARDQLKSSPFLERTALTFAFNRLDKPTKRANKNFQKYLGREMSDVVTNYLPEYQNPKFYNSSNYVRAGHTIVLFADKDYYVLFPDEDENIWKHHMFESYLFLAEKLGNELK